MSSASAPGELQPVPPSPPLTRVTTTERETLSDEHHEKGGRMLATPEPAAEMDEKRPSPEARNGTPQTKEYPSRRTAPVSSRSGDSGLRIPRSSYYVGPPPSDSAYGTEPAGRIGVHHPREILRVERDYSGGEVIQFHPAYPLELEGRITHTQFQETINSINEVLISAHSLLYSFLDNMLAICTLYISWLFIDTHYDREMRRLEQLIERLNRDIYNPAAVNILWPRKVAFLFLEIEYY